MKTSEILNVYNFLASHDKYGKMGTSKVTLVLMLVKMEKIVKEFEDFQTKTYKKLYADKENFEENLAKAQQYELNLRDNVTENLPMTKEEYETFMQNDYKEVVAQLQEALQPELDKEVDLTYKKLTEEGFSAWMEANDVDTKTAAQLSPYLLEE